MSLISYSTNIFHFVEWNCAPKCILELVSMGQSYVTLLSSESRLMRIFSSLTAILEKQTYKQNDRIFFSVKNVYNTFSPLVNLGNTVNFSQPSIKSLPSWLRRKECFPFAKAFLRSPWTKPMMASFEPTSNNWKLIYVERCKYSK